MDRTEAEAGYRAGIVRRRCGGGTGQSQCMNEESSDKDNKFSLPEQKVLRELLGPNSETCGFMTAAIGGV